MELSITIEIDMPDDDNGKVCDAVTEACIRVIGDMRKKGTLRLDEQRYVTEMVRDEIIGQVCYYRPA